MEWISVETRLPENDSSLHFHRESCLEFCSVLVCGKFVGCESADSGVTLANRILQKKTGSAYIDREMKEGWHWSSSMAEVTHWMPLPSPPVE